MIKVTRFFYFDYFDNNRFAKQMNITPNLKEFGKLAESCTHVPLLYEFSGDLDTPVSLYEKIRGESPYSFLLESALQSGSSGRYSIIGFLPKSVIRSKDGIIEVLKDGEIRQFESDPIEYLREIMSGYKVAQLNDPLPFTGGLVGYFSYDTIRLVENIPDSTTNDLEMYDYELLLTDNFIIFDHYRHILKLVNVIETGKNIEYSYSKGCDTLKKIAALFKKSTRLHYEDIGANGKDNLIITSNITRDKFKANVESAKDHIVAGDVFQIVLSQRLSVVYENDVFNIYRSLRRLNPSPYMFYFSMDNTVIAGSSPEVLVKNNNGYITTRPLAGTRKRSKSDYEDKILADELLKDEKECAEHVMLVDLGRNDLGRFCKFGSIAVPEFMGIEKYSHVMHIVSEVTGRLAPNKDSFDVLFGSFPAGTVTGAPKIRAMEIIDDLEETRRGVYAGAVGYIDFQNNMDTCIAIRTLVAKNNTVFIQAGAGIVADSIPENEYNETMLKAGALLNAIAAAEGKSYDFSD